MTIAERNNKLKHFITCLKCKVSGKNCDVNCPTQYDAGNTGEIIENLEAISKALNQEPYEDTVSRQAVIETIFVQGSAEKLEIDFAKLLLLQRAIKALPSVIPQEQRWILVSERLPEDKEIVLITSSDMYLSKLNPWCGWKNGNNWYTFTANGSFLIKYPIAWMPLPKAYEPQERNNKE